MSVEPFSTVPTSSEPRYPTGLAAGGPAVINLQEIKSILYLGFRGKIPVPSAAESHRVDTFA